MPVGGRFDTGLHPRFGHELVPLDLRRMTGLLQLLVMGSRGSRVARGAGVPAENRGERQSTGLHYGSVVVVTAWGKGRARESLKVKGGEAPSSCALCATMRVARTHEHEHEHTGGNHRGMSSGVLLRRVRLGARWPPSWLRVLTPELELLAVC